MNGIGQFSSLVDRYPCCSKLSKKGRECVQDLSRRGCVDRVLNFEDNGVYNGNSRFCSYSTGSFFPDNYYDETVYDEIPNLVMPYGRIGNRTLHRNLGRMVQYQDMPIECKNQMTLAFRRMRDFGVRDRYSDTHAFVLDLSSPIDLHYMIESTPLRLRTSQLVTLVLNDDSVMIPSRKIARCDQRPQRISELKRHYCVQCSLTEPRCNGMPRSNLTKVTPRFTATDLVSSDFLKCDDDKAVLTKKEIDYAMCLIDKANRIMKKHEPLDRQLNNIAWINSRERVYDYVNMIQILKNLNVSNCKLRSREQYKNLWIAENAIRSWLSSKLGVVP